MKIKIIKRGKYPKSLLKIINSLKSEEFGVFHREFSLFTTSCFCLSTAFANKHYVNNAIRLSISGYRKEMSSHFIDLRFARIIGNKFIEDKEIRKEIIRLHTHFGNKVLKLFRKIDTVKTLTPNLVMDLSLAMGKFFAHNILIQTSVDCVARSNFEVYKLLLKQRKRFEKELVGRIEFYIDKMCQKLAAQKRTSLHLLKFLTPTEMIDFIKYNRLPASLSKRVNSWVLIRWPKPTLLIGKSASDLFNKLKQHERKLNKELFSENRLKGITAYQGIVKGRAQVVRDFSQFEGFKKGNILIAFAIAPKYYIFLIKKLKGIVMDEGGMLSHAAILSRELKIPCIVGTRIATKILRDDDLIELDANKGLVKILQRKNNVHRKF